MEPTSEAKKGRLRAAKCERGIDLFRPFRAWSFLAFGTQGGASVPLGWNIAALSGAARILRGCEFEADSA